MNLVRYPLGSVSPILRPMNKVGVCSWSLRPASPADLVRSLRSVAVDCVQLALGPFGPATPGGWSVDETLGLLRDAGIEVRSGMIGMRGEDYSTLDSIRRTGGVRADEHWEANFANARTSATIARSLGTELVTLHAGFLPEDGSDSERATLIDRLRAITDAFAEQGVRVGFETGQESAETLLGVLDELDRPTAGVNFDPANMILYAMGDPVEALARLAPRVCQIHIKDALRTKVPGTWGEEVRTGTGEVDWQGFFAVLRERELHCDLMIEREAGAARMDDIRAARELVEGLRSGGTAG